MDGMSWVADIVNTITRYDIVFGVLIAVVLVFLCVIYKLTIGQQKLRDEWEKTKQLSLNETLETLSKQTKEMNTERNELYKKVYEKDFGAMLESIGEFKKAINQRVEELIEAMDKLKIETNSERGDLG